MPVPPRPHRSILLALASLLLLTAAACGGDDDTDAVAGGDTPADDTPADDTGSDDDAGDAGDTDSGEVGATVTIGDTTYVGTNEVQCISMGGALGAQFTDTDGAVTIYIDMPPQDWETDTQSDWPPPSARVDDDVDPQGNLQWLAGTDVAMALAGVAPDSGITEFSFGDDGLSASGSGQFVETSEILTGGQGTLVDGTFEVQCSS